MKRETTALPCTLPPSVFLTNTVPLFIIIIGRPPKTHSRLFFPLLLSSLSLSLCSGWLKVQACTPLGAQSDAIFIAITTFTVNITPVCPQLKKPPTRKQDRSAGCPTNVLLLMRKFQIIPLNASLSATHAPPPLTPTPVRHAPYPSRLFRLAALPTGLIVVEKMLKQREQTARR